MGRTPRIKDKPSDEDVRMRCTSVEKAVWERCAAHHGLTLSDWMRVALTKQEVKDAQEMQR